MRNNGVGLLPDPTEVPVTLVRDRAGVDAFARAVAAAERIAIDTETHSWNSSFHGVMRVLIAAMRDSDGIESCYVVDVRDVDAALLAPILAGVEVDGWNGTFDARVTDDAIFTPANANRPHDGRFKSIRWYDGMFADAVLHQGVTGFTWFHGLAWATRRYLGFTLEGKGTTQTSFTADDDLSDEQLQYAALDAITTLRVCDHLRGLVEQAGLTRALQLELRARPFLDHMERAGLPFDWVGWKAYLAELSEKKDEMLDRLSQLTGGGQPNIFTGLEIPAWKPNSADDVKAQLNKHCRDLVLQYFENSTGTARLFEKPDKADKDTLKAVGGELCKALLEYRDVEKILSTYGENLEEYRGSDERMHPQYLQIVGTNTGRLSSRKPNAQNFTPRAKPYFRPLMDGRVFVYADLSQAELRFLAQESGDEAMLSAFREGKDIHVATAERMFSVDMADLKDSDPGQFKVFRSKAKTLNFGIVYGLGPAALANSLTLSGVPTSTEEGKALLDAYLLAYPQVAAWLKKRDDFIRSLADNPPQVDLAATLRLKDIHGSVVSAAKAFTKVNGRAPEDDELTERVFPKATLAEALAQRLGREVTADEVDAEFEVRMTEVAWAREFEAPVVLAVDGTPVGFSSFTKVGRRRQFQISTDSLLLSMATMAAQDRVPRPNGARRAGRTPWATARDEFAAANRVTLAKPSGEVLDRDTLKKVFEDRELMRSFINMYLSKVGADARNRWVQGAARDRISAMGNAFRNAPIQGGVADVALAAYGHLFDEVLDAGSAFADVVPVQTVHDSITFECNEADAPALARLLKTVMEKAMSNLCPDVPAVADADIRTSLDDKSVLEELAAA